MLNYSDLDKRFKKRGMHGRGCIAFVLVQNSYCLLVVRSNKFYFVDFLTFQLIEAAANISVKSRLASYF